MHKRRGFIMASVLGFKCMISCTLILRQWQSKTTFQVLNNLLKNTIEGQLQDKTQKLY